MTLNTAILDLNSIFGLIFTAYLLWYGITLLNDEMEVRREEKRIRKYQQNQRKIRLYKEQALADQEIQQKGDKK